MTTYYVVVESVAGTAAEGASLEVSSPTGGTFTFTVYTANGGQVTTFQLTTNADKFASTASHTGNLFSLTNYASLRVVVEVNQTISAVMLRHTTTGINNTVTRLTTIPDTARTVASTFSFPQGNLGSGAHALVGNHNAVQIAVALRYGTPTSAVVSTTYVPANGLAIIPLGNNDANMVLTSTYAFTAQVLVANGANPFMETFILANP